MKNVRLSVLSKNNLLTLALVIFVGILSAQNVAINDGGLAPDSSAMLDIASQDKGLLIPRLRSTERINISNPANGLLVFQVDPPRGFYAYFTTPGVWTRITMDSTLSLDHVLAVGNDGGNQDIVGLSSLSIGSNNTNFAKLKVIDSIPNLRLTSGSANSPTNLENSGVIEFMENDMDFEAGGFGFQMRYIASTNDRFQIRSAAGGIIDTLLSIRRGLGYVGIREDNPRAQLHVKSSIQSVLRLEREGTAESYLHFANDNYDLINGLDAGGNYGIFNNGNTFGGKFLISNAGNVGIAQTNPGARLHLIGNTRLSQINESNVLTGTWLVLGNTSTGGQYHHLISTGSNNGEGAGKLLFGYGASAATVDNITMTIDDRRVGIRTSSPSNDLEIVQSDALTSGTGGIRHTWGTSYWRLFHSGLHYSFDNDGVRYAYVESGTGNYVQPSDKNLKENIQLISPVLDRISKLRPVNYNYIRLAEKEPITTYGFIAQEVLESFPSLVHYGENGELGLAYSEFGVIAIKAIQEQQQKIDELEARIRKLEDLINNIQKEQ